MVEIKPNANFYSIGGTSVPDNPTAEYRQYRSCWMEFPENFILRDFPMHLDIETTSRCNFKCTFCDKLPVLKKEDLGDMDFNLYKRIIDEGKKHKLWGVKLSYRGEPLLHKDIIEMVSYAKKSGILDVYFNTNGMLLDEPLAVRLIGAGLDRISISIEAISKEEFEKKRIGAKFGIILENIDNLMRLRKKMGVNHPKIRIQSIYLTGIDIDSYKSFWISHCDEIAMVDYKDGSKREKGLMREWACPQLWQRMTIDWEGNVSPCNNDDLFLLSPGNVKEKSIYECWHDINIEGVRLLHKEGNSHKVEACDGCPWRTAQIKKYAKN